LFFQKQYNTFILPFFEKTNMKSSKKHQAFIKMKNNQCFHVNVNTTQLKRKASEKTYDGILKCTCATQATPKYTT